MLRSLSFLSCVVALLGSAAADPKPAPADNHTPAECEPIVKKMWPIVKDLAKQQGHPLKDSDQADFIKACKDGLAKNPHDPTMTCVAKAGDDAAIRACLTSAIKESGEISKRTEAALQLNKLGKNIKIYYITNAEFPKGKAKQLPEKACCAQPDHKCAVTTAWEKDSVWAALDFQIDDPNLFQYTYESDGKTAKATAVGDPSCSGKPITYTLEAKAVDGNPKVTITEPK